MTGLLSEDGPQSQGGALLGTARGMVTHDVSAATNLPRMACLRLGPGPPSEDSHDCEKLWAA